MSFFTDPSLKVRSLRKVASALRQLGGAADVWPEWDQLETGWLIFYPIFVLGFYTGGAGFLNHQQS